MLKKADWEGEGDDKWAFDTRHIPKQRTQAESGHGLHP